MKTIEQKAEEYIEPFRTSLLGCETDLMKKAYLQGAKDAIAGQWRKPEELEDYECDRFFTQIIVKYHTLYRGSWLTIISINDVNLWTDDIDEYHKGDDLIAWMPIPETPKPEEQ